MDTKLAIHGGKPAKTTPNISMYPGGLAIGREEKKAVMDVLNKKYLFRYYGPEKAPSKVREFEVKFAKKVGSQNALAVNSCTSALITSLVACGVGPGHEVIVPGYTFFASCAAVVAAKAIPVIAEVDDSLTLDPVDFERKITPSTKAVVAVHMRGIPCQIDKIVAIAKKHKIMVIEDVAQACGATYKGKYLGTFGDCGCFSFQYHKIITAGEGGIIVTNNPKLYDRCMAYHDTAACWREDRFGLPRYPGEVFCGVNFRMSELSGAVMVEQLKKLDGFLKGMRRNKARIKNAIKDIPGIEFRRIPDEKGETAIALIFFLPTKEVTNKFVKALRAEGVGAAGLFNSGIPDWHVYSHWRHVIDKVTPTPEGCPYTCPYHKGPEVKYSPDMCPNTLAWLGRSVQIDIPPQMTARDCDMIAAGIKKVANAYL
jgi:dTDP-4-amino-4,6-dideoxygalactose transaminase